MNNRQKGALYERKAAEFLEKQGVRIVERNFRCRQGEIDIIGYHSTCLVFFEVKARDSMVSGTGAEAVDLKKQKRICRAADYYRYLHRIGEFTRMRYDCIAIDQGRISWIQNAFEHRR